MKDFEKSLTNLIVNNERGRLSSVLGEVASKIQQDMVATTYGLIDAFYQDYQIPPRIYIRTDEYKAKHNNQKDKKGRWRPKKSDMEFRRGRDVSLMTAVKSMNADGQPAIGVCKPFDGEDWSNGGYAGVIFDESYFESKMKHSVKGVNFTEWDIVEDFLWGVHGNENVHTTTPSAGYALHQYVNSYKPRFDTHYKNALKKYGRK